MTIATAAASRAITRSAARAASRRRIWLACALCGQALRSPESHADPARDEGHRPLAVADD